MMHGACVSTDKGLVDVALPLATRLHPEIPRHGWFSLQMLLLEACASARKRNELIEGLDSACGGNPRAELLRIAAERLALAVKRASYQYDALVDERIQSMLMQWLQAIPQERCERFSAYVRVHTGGVPVSSDMVARKSASTKGRMRHGLEARSFGR